MSDMLQLVVGAPDKLKHIEQLKRLGQNYRRFTEQL